MMMDAVLAIALGLVPVEEGAPAMKVHVSPAQMVKGYTEKIDRRGNTHLRGFDPRSGKRYHVTVGKTGKVEGRVGDNFVTFDASPAS